MHTSVDISLYPLRADYLQPIITFIQRLQGTAGLTVATNPLSTQVSGDYDLVMDTLKEAMRDSLAHGTTCAFVLKVLNVAVEPGEILRF